MTLHTLKTLCAAAILVAAAAVQAQTQAPAQAGDGVKLCHIANAGFLVEGREAAVVFDAARITDEYDGNYGLPSAGLMADLTAGTGAFSRVKLALVSHRHNDHFDAEATLAHLRGDADVRYLMPPEAHDMLKAAGLTEAEEARAMAVLPPWEDGPLEYEFDGVKLEAYRVDHGPDRPQNIGWRVTVDGVSFFHTGDINASGESLIKAGLEAVPVDVMLLAFWYGMNNPAQSKAILDSWQIGAVVPIHLAPGEKGWMKRFGGRDGYMKMVHGQWPGSVRLTEEMACHVFEAKD